MKIRMTAFEKDGMRKTPRTSIYYIDNLSPQEMKSRLPELVDEYISRCRNIIAFSLSIDYEENGDSTGFLSHPMVAEEGQSPGKFFTEGLLDQMDLVSETDSLTW